MVIQHRTELDFWKKSALIGSETEIVNDAEPIWRFFDQFKKL